MFIPSSSGVSLQVHAVCASSPVSKPCRVLAAASVTVSLMKAVHGKRDGKANRSSSRPFCSRVMKERRVVMKERAIPGPCNCCPRIQYYSMGLAIWTDCIPKRDIYIYICTIGSLIFKGTASGVFQIYHGKSHDFLWNN